LKRDFRRIDPSHARIILIEAAPSVLSHFPPDLSASATRQLQQLGVQVRTSTKVKTIRKRRWSWKPAKSCAPKIFFGPPASRPCRSRRNSAWTWTAPDA